MSRAKPVAERNALDFYATPGPLALAICKWMASTVKEPRYVVEPSAGSGAFVDAVRATWPLAWVGAVESNNDHRPSLYGRANMLWIDDWPRFVEAQFHHRCPPPDLIIGNPPYRQAVEHIAAALRWLGDGGQLAFLLRLNLLGSRSRLGLWASSPLAEVVPIVPRPSFTGGGSDATEYALFRWQKGHAGPARLSQPLCWDKTRGNLAASIPGSTLAPVASLDGGE